MPTVQLRDIISYYEEAGSAEPVVLIAGLGSDSRAWARQMPVLAQTFRVITFDNRGAGRTSAPDRPYSVGGLADDVAALLDALGIAKAHVVGLSFGAAIAQELAAAHAGRVNRLALISPAVALDGLARQVVRTWIDARRSNLSHEAVQRQLATWLYGGSTFSDEARFEEAIAGVRHNPYPQQDHAFIRQADAWMDYDGSARLKDVKAETLVLYGEEDRFLGASHAEAVAGLLPSAAIQALPGGHFGPLEHPREHNDALAAFLSGAGG